MKSKLKNDTFHIKEKISGEISLDFTNQNISKKLNKIIKSKNIKRKNRRKILIKEQNLMKKSEQKFGNLITNKIRKEFIPLPLINNKEENSEKYLQFSDSKLFQINNNSFSYINKNNKLLNKQNISQKEDNINNENMKNKDDNNNIIYFFKKNFECKEHPNNKYTAYCSKCQNNICEKCLLNDLSHNEHKIYFYKDLMPSEIQIKYYSELFIYSKEYLDRIREIIIEIYNDLSDFYEIEKNNVNKLLIENIQRRLKRGFIHFYRKNLYLLIYAKKIVETFCCWKKLQCVNYQIISNLYDIKINSVKIPDLFDQHIIIKAKTMIEFMMYNRNNILKSSDSALPSTIYNYKNIKNKKGPKINSINIDNYKSFFDLFSKNKGIIYESNFKLNNNYFSKSKSEDQHNKRDNNKISNNKLSIIQDKENNIKEILSLINDNIKNKINEDNNNEKEEKNNKINIIKENINENKSVINITEKEENIINNISKELITNFDSEIQKYIFANLPKPLPDDVEYKKNIPYLYYDKRLQKNISCKYHGEFKKNTLIRHGRGLFIWEDGEYYLGYWINDKRDGKGTNNYANGDIYEGEYKNGKKEGKGTYKWKNGDIYIGDWKNDMKEGEGRYKYNNGDKYIGLFKMDKIEGNGKYIWSNNNTYNGQFKNNEIEGKGILNYISNNVNKEIKDIYNKINYKKTKDKQEVNEENNKSNDDKKYIEIFTCDRNDTNINNSKEENKEIK